MVLQSKERLRKMYVLCHGIQHLHPCSLRESYFDVV
jgi:hypothetical protein